MPQSRTSPGEAGNPNCVYIHAFGRSAENIVTSSAMESEGLTCQRSPTLFSLFVVSTLEIPEYFQLTNKAGGRSNGTAVSRHTNQYLRFEIRIRTRSD